MRERFELFRGAIRNFQNHGDLRETYCRRGAIVASSRHGEDGLDMDFERLDTTPKIGSMIYFEVRKNVWAIRCFAVCRQGKFCYEAGPGEETGLSSRCSGRRPLAQRQDGCGQRSRREETSMYLGLDLGTSGVKALLIDTDQAIVASANARARRVAAASRLVGTGPRPLDQGDRGSGRQAQALARQGARRGQRHRPVRPDAWRDAD